MKTKTDEQLVLDLKVEENGKTIFGFTNTSKIIVEGRTVCVSVQACMALAEFIRNMYDQIDEAKNEQ